MKGWREVACCALLQFTAKLRRYQISLDTCPSPVIAVASGRQSRGKPRVIFPDIFPTLPLRQPGPTCRSCKNQGSGYMAGERGNKPNLQIAPTVFGGKNVR